MGMPVIRGITGRSIITRWRTARIRTKAIKATTRRRVSIIRRTITRSTITTVGIILTLAGITARATTKFISGLLPVALVVAGVAFWSVPAALIVAGLALLADRLLPNKP